MEPAQFPGVHRKLPWINHSVDLQLLQAVILAEQNAVSNPADLPRYHCDEAYRTSVGEIATMSKALEKSNWITSVCSFLFKLLAISLTINSS